MMDDPESVFEAARDMFLTEGWQNFIDEIEGLIETLTLDSASTSDDFFHSKGKLEALRVVANYESAVLATEAQHESVEDLVAH